MSPNNKSVPSDENNTNKEEISEKMKINRKPLPEKNFQNRNSLLTDLFDSNPHIKVVYHIFIATLLCLFVNTVAHDYLKNGEIKLGVYLIYTGFGKFHIAVFSWLGFFVNTCICYCSFSFWANVRIAFLPKSKNLKIWDSLWLLSLVSYYLFSFSISAFVVSTFKLPPATSAVILLEQTRFLMKIHAFVRSNAPNVLNYKPHSDMKLEVPPFSKYLYFLFAPTIVYRNVYPRTKEIRWSFVIYRALEIGGVIFYYSFILDKFVFPVYADFGLRKFTWNEIVLSIFENTIPGILILLSTFYLVLHSVQNLFAELLRFGDRMFYKDWWTCTTFSEYFRTWNVVVHDWLYAYIYKDMYEIVAPGNKTVAKFTVFILSAVVHEWVLCNMFGFFFPVLFIQFFFGGALLSSIKAPKITVLNVLFWYGLAFGFGILMSMYTLEFCARMNVPTKENYSLFDYLVPKWLGCDCIE